MLTENSSRAWPVKTFKDRDAWIRLFLAVEAQPAGRPKLRPGTLTHAAKVVGTSIALHQHIETGRCDPKLDDLASCTGISKRHIRRMFRELEQEGWMGIESGGRHNGCIFELRVPAHIDSRGDRTTVVHSRDSEDRTTVVLSSDFREDGADHQGGRRRSLDRPTVGRTRQANLQANKQAKRERKSKTGWPSDLVLNPELVAIAMKEGFDLGRSHRMFDKFKHHHQSKGSIFADWTAAWRYWVHNQVDFDAKAKAAEPPVSNFL